MGSEARTAQPKLYINVMELLVAEEVDRQLSRLPERVSKYIKRTEVETFALNRLPALYASSEKGLQHQHDRAIHDFRPQIASAVRQAFAAVQVDPIRLSQPLQLHQEEEAVLQALREYLQSPDLTWKSALREIQRMQNRRRTMAAPPPPPPRTPASKAAKATAEAMTTAEEEQHNTAWRPGTYGSRISWRPRHTSPANPPASSEGGFGENAL